MNAEELVSQEAVSLSASFSWKPFCEQLFSIVCFQMCPQMACPQCPAGYILYTALAASVWFSPVCPHSLGKTYDVTKDHKTKLLLVSCLVQRRSDFFLNMHIQLLYAYLHWLDWNLPILLLYKGTLSHDSWFKLNSMLGNTSHNAGLQIGGEMMFPALLHTLYSCHTHVTISSVGAPLAEGPLCSWLFSFLSFGCSSRVTQAFTNMWRLSCFLTHMIKRTHIPRHAGNAIFSYILLVFQYWTNSNFSATGRI